MGEKRIRRNDSLHKKQIDNQPASWGEKRKRKDDSLTLMVIVVMMTMRMRQLGWGQHRWRRAQTTDNNQLKVAAEETVLSPLHNNNVEGVLFANFWEFWHTKGDGSIGSLSAICIGPRKNTKVDHLIEEKCSWLGPTKHITTQRMIEDGVV